MKVTLSNKSQAKNALRLLFVDAEKPANSLKQSHLFSDDEQKVLKQFFKTNSLKGQTFCLWSIQTLVHGVESFSPDAIRQAAGKINSTLQSYSPEVVIADCEFLGAESCGTLAEGLVLSQYKFSMFKEKGYTTSELQLFKGDKAAQKIVEHRVIAAESTNFARDIANAPGNCMTPKILAEKAVAMAKEFGLKSKVLGESEMKKLGMNALLAVSAGSVHEAQLIAVKYTHPQAKKTIALVGKGLTFDAGGVCLKQARGMSEMKYDKSGAAAVLGAIRTIAQIKPKINVVAVVPSSENVTGPAAYKPGDVIKAYNGINIEVINTDAEGRMILCDALAWTAEQYKPDKMINIATLTGASISSLGHGVTALMSNTEGLAGELIAAGKKNAEPAWELPIGPSHFEILESSVADIKHTFDGPEASLIIGSAFLSKFVADTPWVAIDIGATAWNFRGASFISREGASGSCCRMLSTWVLDQI